jgi:hypothetical protein
MITKLDTAGATAYSSLSLGGVRPHFETLQSIALGLIIVRVAKFRRPLIADHEQLRRHRAIVTAKQNIESKLTVFFSEEHVDGSS